MPTLEEFIKFLTDPKTSVTKASYTEKRGKTGIPCCNGKSEEKSTDAPVVTHSLQRPVIKETQISTTSNKEEESRGIYYAQRSASRVILSTARVYVQEKDGSRQSCRALLDPGSQSNLIIEKLARKLKLQYRSEDRAISGISQTKTTIKKVTEIQLSSAYNNFETTLKCLVLPSITEDLPQSKIDVKNIVLPKDIQLADPVFKEPGSIDLLIGAALYWKIVTDTPRNRIEGQPALQNMQLGGYISAYTQ
ncbi:Uncharacterized protein DBV15_12752 [Temnothorax longispinosus]|uniref:Uncharacterized protein n=1 Tax=Temnothorax longispinosus TaxID=300112 RepID=A0A4S2KAK2_9HYME|nr:Uncharacterized protein DBV15_12752 [Temnothorax longispinosus]